jgi:hypothetical protein
MAMICASASFQGCVVDLNAMCTGSIGNESDAVGDLERCDLNKHHIASHSIAQLSSHTSTYHKTFHGMARHRKVSHSSKRTTKHGMTRHLHRIRRKRHTTHSHVLGGDSELWHCGKVHAPRRERSVDPRDEKVSRGNHRNIQLISAYSRGQIAFCVNTRLVRQTR